jgi:hypothetical protein
MKTNQIPESIIEIVTMPEYPPSTARRRIETVEFIQPHRRDELSSDEFYREPEWNDYPGFRLYYRHKETGQRYLDFVGGLAWPYDRNHPGCGVVVGVKESVNTDGIPDLEVMEAFERVQEIGGRESQPSLEGLFQGCLEMRCKYGARRAPFQLLDIWFGNCGSGQINSLHAFNQKIKNDTEYGTMSFSMTFPGNFSDPDYSKTSIILLMEYLKRSAERKRLYGINNHILLENEIKGVQDFNIKIEERPALAALCYTLTSINPLFNQPGEWEKAIIHKTSFPQEDEWSTK